MVRAISVESRLVSALAIPDPVDRYKALVSLADVVEGLRVEVRRGRSGCVQALRADGLTWREVGDRLGLSLQRAEQLARD